MTVLDAYQAIDEIVTSYQHEAVSAERALSHIAAIIADYESGDAYEAKECTSQGRISTARF